MKTEIELLQQQVATLQRDLRRQRWTNTGLVVCGLVAFCAAGAVSQDADETSPTPRDLQLRSLAIVNDKGNKVMTLGADERGGLLKVNDSAGVNKASLGVLRTGGAVLIHGEEGKGASLLVGDEGGALYVKSTDGKPAGVFGTNPYGGSLILGGKDGQPRGSLDVDRNGNGMMSLQASDGKPRVMLFVTREEKGDLGLLDKDGKVIN